MTHSPSFRKSYADFGLSRSVGQVKHAITYRSKIEQHLRGLEAQIQVAEQRMVSVAGRPIVDFDILEVGPGQGMERALYFNCHNRVTTIDSDVIPFGFEGKAYWRMLRNNGVGRFAKTLGRELLVGRVGRKAWRSVLGCTARAQPARVSGDIAATRLPQTFDLVMSWSVFEHVSDPQQALHNILQMLNPGGIFYISLHLYTCNNGHHDIRAFTGSESDLPLWAHLRDNTRHLVRPSAYLNEWRLAQWRNIFQETTPDVTEILEQFEHPQLYGPRLAGDLRAELRDYSDDELLTVNAVYMGHKPA